MAVSSDLWQWIPSDPQWNDLISVILEYLQPCWTCFHEPCCCVRSSQSVRLTPSPGDRQFLELFSFLPHPEEYLSCYQSQNMKLYLYCEVCTRELPLCPMPSAGFYEVQPRWCSDCSLASPASTTLLL